MKALHRFTRSAARRRQRGTARPNPVPARASARVRVGLSLVVAIALLPTANRASLSARPMEFKVIVNESNPIENISRSELSDLFLKKSKAWGHGGTVVPVEPPESSDLRESFAAGIHGRSLAAVLAYWRRKMFSGRGEPPEIRDSDPEIVRYVKSNPTAVGYVSIDCIATGVKVVRVEGSDAVKQMP